jgi:hypothetical protein
VVRHGMVASADKEGAKEFKAEFAELMEKSYLL